MIGHHNPSTSGVQGFVGGLSVKEILSDLAEGLQAEGPGIGLEAVYLTGNAIHFICVQPVLE